MGLRREGCKVEKGEDGEHGSGEREYNIVFFYVYVDEFMSSHTVCLAAVCWLGSLFNKNLQTFMLTCTILL